MVYRLDVATASSTAPLAGTVGVEGYPTAGSPPLVPPATIDPYFVYALCEEIRNVVTAAGVVPTKNVVNQQLQALRRLFGGNRLLVTESGTLTADNAGLVVVNAEAGPVTMTLPAAAGAGGAPLKFIFIRTDTTTNAVTVQDAGSDTDAPGDATSEPVLLGSPLWLESDGVSVWDVLLTSTATALAYVIVTGSMSFTPVARESVLFGDNGAPATVTIQPGAFPGQKIRAYCAAPLTVQSNVSTGSPAFNYPDGSSGYSITLASGLAAGMVMEWDGGGWRCSTTGQTIVAPAVAANQAVPLGQSVASSALNNVTASRAFGTTYTNSTAKLMIVSVWGHNTSTTNIAALDCYVDGVQISETGVASQDDWTAVFFVPMGATYEVQTAGAVTTLTRWIEWN